MRDVAKLAGVSLKTVSRVINDEAPVRPKTRERVLKAVQASGYARPLPQRGMSYTIALAYNNAHPYYIAAMLNGCLNVCRELGFGLQILPCDPHAQDGAQSLLGDDRHPRVAGLVLTPPISEEQRLLRSLDDAGMRFVRVLSAAENPDDGWPCIYVDDRDAAYDITEYLIKLGHTRIAFLWGSEHHQSSRERFAGYADALRHYRIAVEKKLVMKGEYSFDDGFRRARWLLSLKNPPTAIFGANDEIAAGVLAAAHAARLDVPYDLSVAGFEDNPFSRQSWPPLTTAHQDTTDIANQATRMLIAQLTDSPRKSGMRNKGFSPKLVVRGSTAPPPQRK